MSLSFGDVSSLVGARVLIVEDEGIVAKDLDNSLRTMGFCVCGTASTGKEAIAQAAAARPDIVLMDIRLRDDMDGIEAARRIRAQMSVPVVFLTAYADPATLNRAAEVGPYGYVLKPFDERELQVALIIALWKHRAFADLDRDVSERTEQLARTEARYRRLEAVAELGLFALGTTDIGAVLERAIALVAATLDVELVEVLELNTDGSRLTLHAGIGWQPGLVGHATVGTTPDLQAGYTLASADPVVVSDFTADRRFRRSSLLAAHDAAGGVSVIIQGAGHNGRPYGVLGGYAKKARTFSDADVHFLQAVANVVAASLIRSGADSKLRAAERLAEEERVRAELAEDAVHTRDMFLSVASHELRTPVAALQLQLEALRHLMAPLGTHDERVTERVDRARQTVRRLTSLIEDVLDVSRIALGKLELARERFDLAAVAKDVIARHYDMALAAGCRVRLSVPDAVIGIWDRVRVEQVLTNLLSNALKFGAGKPVDVQVEARGEHARLVVSDQGEGIDPADKERILHRFERAASHHRYGGLGLGLYIVRQVVEAHGGTLEVCSRPQHGAAITVTLPRNEAQPGPP